MRPVLPALLLLLAAPGAADPIPFTIEAVDDTASNVCCLDLSVDSERAPHVVFNGALDADGAGLHYLVRRDGQWAPLRSFIGTNASLALDHLGRPHISYSVRRGGALDSLYYATLDDEGWDIETIDRNQIRFFSSLALDSNEEPHVAYMKFTTGGFPFESEIVYRRRATGDWPRLANAISAPNRLSLALDPADQPQIVAPQMSGGLTNPTFYYRMVSGILSPESLGPFSPLSPRGVSKLVLDPAGIPHVALVEAQSRDVWYGTRGAAGWTFETASARDQAGFPGLVLDAAGDPHICFYEPARHEVAYARREAGVWTEQAVETGVTVTQLGIAMDVDGNPHIAYSLDNLQLRYAVGRLHARALAFVAGGDRTIHMGDERPSVSIQLQPEGNGFDLSEVDPTAVTLTRDDGIGGSSTATRAVRDLDRDRDGVVELRVTFDKDALISLFADIQGDALVPVTLRAPLARGGNLVAHMVLEVDGAHGSKARVQSATASSEPRAEGAGGLIDVRVFDLSGRCVLRFKTAGHSDAFGIGQDAERAGVLRPGLYFYRADVARESRDGRFVVLR